MVGCGMMGQFAHLRNYLSIPECEVVALAELRPRLRQLAAERYGIARTYVSHRELLEDPDVEAVCAVLPAHLTGPVGIDVLAAGKHLVESLDKFKVPEREKNEVLASVNKLKGDIVEKP